MRKLTILATAIGAVGCMTANAQSSVALYGIIDEGLMFNSNANGHRQYAMASGVMQGSRWGLRGTEELGGGLKALFVLENGFDVNNGRLGQGGLGFGRQAFVGLSDTRLGIVTLGRQYDSIVDFVAPNGGAQQWAGYESAHPGDIDNFNNSSRVNNAIKYASPRFGPVSFGGLYSLGGVAGDYTRNQLYSVGANFVTGPLSLAAGYMNVRNANIGFWGNNTTSTPSALTANNPGGSPVYSGFASAHTYSVAAASGAYTFGAATFGVTYSNVRFSGLGDTSSGPNPVHYSGNTSFNNAEVNLKYQFTPSLLAGLMYDYTNGGSVGAKGSAIYHQVASGLDYFLSKRTDVYGIVTYQHASGTDSRGLPAVAALNALTPSDSNHQVAVRLGIRHKF